MKSIFDINGFLAEKLDFSLGLWLLIASLTFALLCVCFLFSVGRGRLKARQMFIETGWLALWYWGIVALSLVTLFPKDQPLWQPAQHMPYWCGAAGLIVLGFLLYFFRRKKHFANLNSATAIRKSAAGSGAARYCFALLFAGMLVSSVICGVRIGMGDSIYHLLVPMVIVALTLVLHGLTRWRIWFFLAGLIILAYDFLMMQNVVATTGFQYFPLLAMTPLQLSILLPLFSLSGNKYL
ncbi:MAG: hypothetical protein J5702_00565 [Bacteroidales bacterium]|nr:hypothetical protein [Bacteroidales bacterium]